MRRCRVFASASDVVAMTRTVTGTSAPTGGNAGDRTGTGPAGTEFLVPGAPVGGRSDDGRDGHPAPRPSGGGTSGVTGTKTWENVMRRRAGASRALRRTAVALGVATLCATLAGCRGDGVIEGDDTTPAAGSTDGSTTNADQSSGDSGTTAYAVSAPGPLKDRLYRADVLIRSAETLPESVVRKIRAIKGVEAVEPLSVASASIEGRTLDVAAVDPATFRQFTPEASARA